MPISQHAASAPTKPSASGKAKKSLPQMQIRRTGQCRQYGAMVLLPSVVATRVSPAGMSAAKARHPPREATYTARRQSKGTSEVSSKG